MANKTILPKDYAGLFKEHKSIIKELDANKQELHDSKRQLKVAEALQYEYRNEIELIQLEYTTTVKKLNSRIVELEESLSDTRLCYSERLTNLESTLYQRELENKELKEEIEVLKKGNVTLTQPEDSDKLIEEIVNLKDENEQLFSSNNELKESFDELQKKHYILEESLKEEITNLKEINEIKKSEVNELKDLVEKQNDEIICLKTELEALKSTPLEHANKGNSLFAEVNDRRVYLETALSKIKPGYMEMRQERSQYLQQISQLKKELVALEDRKRVDLEQIEEDHYNITKALRDRITVLESLVDSYKKEKQETLDKPKNMFEEMEVYQTLINRRNKEIEEWKEQLASRTVTHYLLASELAQANKELRILRSEEKKEEFKSWSIKKGPTLPNNLQIDENLDIINREIAGLKKESCYLLKREANESVIKKEHVTSAKALLKEEANVSTENEVTTTKTLLDKDINVTNKNEDSSEAIEKEARENALNQVKVESKLISGQKSKDKENISKEANLEAVPDSVKPAENITRRKTVKFSNDTCEPKITNRTSLRTGGKTRIIKSKPMVFGSEVCIPGGKKQNTVERSVTEGKDILVEKPEKENYSLESKKAEMLKNEVKETLTENSGEQDGIENLAKELNEDEKITVEKPEDQNYCADQSEEDVHENGKKLSLTEGNEMMKLEKDVNKCESDMEIEEIGNC